MHVLIYTYLSVYMHVQISKEEIDHPVGTNTEMSQLCDYPPRIVVHLSPKEPNPTPATLEVTGLNRECSFEIPPGKFDLA